MRLGILPAAGKADRWGGYPKELLPISDGHTLLSRAVETLHRCGCDSVVLVTNPSKIHLHSYHLRDRIDVSYVLQHGDEMWGAMATAMDTAADEYLFMMPDTFLEDFPFPESIAAPLGFGLFTTDEPERFGVFQHGSIVNKQRGPRNSRAWGVLAWTAQVAKHWRSLAYADYTQALNDALRTFEHFTWDLQMYFDVGSMAHYAELLNSRMLNGHSPSKQDVTRSEESDLTEPLRLPWVE